MIVMDCMNVHIFANRDANGMVSNSLSYMNPLLRIGFEIILAFRNVGKLLFQIENY